MLVAFAYGYLGANHASGQSWWTHQVPSTYSTGTRTVNVLPSPTSFSTPIGRPSLRGFIPAGDSKASLPCYRLLPSWFWSLPYRYQERSGRPMPKGLDLYLKSTLSTSTRSSRKRRILIAPDLYEFRGHSVLMISLPYSKESLDGAQSRPLL